MKGVKANDQSLLFLRDDAIDSAKSDDFGHKSIAQSIENSINQSSPPLTIGLFASWGAGKSGIAHILKKSLIKNKKTACIEFDVWKYEDEKSLGRQFIHTLFSQLEEQKLQGDASLNERLEATVSETVAVNLKLDRAKLFNFGILILVIILSGLIAKAFDNSSWVTAVTSIGAIVSIIGLGTILSLGLSIVQNRDKTYTKSRLTESDEFEEEFRGIIDKCAADRIVVIVDNLDRATEENAVRILSTIKSFLEYGKCVFLIPCDEVALKKHLGKVFNDTDNGEKAKNADEYLRKFFNSYIRIPRFIDADLQDYTEKLLKQTNIQSRYQNIQNLATVITSAYRDNPRQIKQFINIFLSHYILAEEREKGGDLPSGEITGNPEFLAKILIIHQKWADVYREILKGQTLSDAGEEQDYVDFLEGSSLAEEPINIKSFLHFKLSKRATDLPTGLAERLETAVEDAKIEDVKNFVTQAQSEKDHTNQLNQFFLALLEDASRTNRRQVIVNIINSLEAVCSSKLLVLSNAVTERVIKSIKDKAQGRDLMAIDESFVSHCISSSTQSASKSAIANKYLDAIESLDAGRLASSDNVAKTLRFIATNQPLFGQSTIKTKLNKIFIPYVQDFDAMQFISQHALIELFQANFLTELASKITKGDITDENSIYDVKSAIINQSPNVDSVTLDKYLDANRLLVHETLQAQNLEQLQIVLPTLLKFLHQKKDLIQSSEITKLTIDTFLQGIRDNGSQQYRILLLKPLLLLRGVADDTQKAGIQSALNEYVKANVANASRELINDQYLEGLTLFNDIRNPLEDMAINDLEFANVIWESGDDDARMSLIDRLLTHTPNLGFQFLDARIEANDITDKNRVSTDLLRLARPAAQAEKPKYFERLVKLKAGGSKEAKEEFASQIVELACQIDAVSQNLAQDTLNLSRDFISKDLRRQSCLSILNWLEQQGKLDHRFITVLNICFDHFDVLKKEDVTRLYEAIFGQWILKEIDPQAILRAKELALDGISKDELSEYIKRLDERIEQHPNLKDQIEELKNYIGSK